MLWYISGKMNNIYPSSYFSMVNYFLMIQSHLEHMTSPLFTTDRIVSFERMDFYFYECFPNMDE
jgi:hypothetical protein